MKSPTKFLSPAALLLALSAPSLAFAQHYTETDLVSNVPISGLTSCATPPVEPCVLIDPNLRNPWGLVHGPTTPWWISNNASGTSILYNTSGLNPPNPAVQTPTPVLVPVTIVALNAPGGQPGNGVVIPNAPSQPPPGSPTAVMFNGSTTDFLLAAGKQASFIWVTEDGTVQGWNPGVLATTAVIKVDNSQVPSKSDGAVYKGATIVEVNGMKYILAANFRHRRIDVFDTTSVRS